MGEWAYIFLVILILSGAAVSSKPNYSTFDEFYENSIQEAFGETPDISIPSLVKIISNLKCTEIKGECREQIITNIEREFFDYILFMKASIEFDGHEIGRCVGIYNKWLCW